MQIDVTSKDIKVTESMRHNIEERLEKLQKFDVPLIKPQLIINQLPNSQIKVEANIGLPNGELVASATEDDFYSAFGALKRKLKRQLRRYSEKPLARRAVKPETDVATEEEESTEA